MLRNPVKPCREIAFSKFERIRNWDSIGFNIKQVLEVLFFDVLRVIGIFGKSSSNRLANRGYSIKVIGWGKNSGVIGYRDGSYGGETISNFNREAGSFLTICLKVSVGCLSLDLLLAIVTLQKFMGKEIRDGILRSFNILNIKIENA